MVLLAMQELNASANTSAYSTCAENKQLPKWVRSAGGVRKHSIRVCGVSA